MKKVTYSLMKVSDCLGKESDGIFKSFPVYLDYSSLFKPNIAYSNQMVFTLVILRAERSFCRLPPV